MTKKTQILFFGGRITIIPAYFVCYLLMMVLLCSLGMWQLRRADEKTLLIQQRQAAGNKNIVDLNKIPTPMLLDLEYQHITVEGVFDVEHQLLIDNQVRNGKAGFFVLTPYFLNGSNKAVLVNRGWVPMTADRKVEADITLAENDEKLSGRVNHFPSVGLKLAGADIPTENWPVIVQIVNTAIIEDRLGYSLLDFQIEMDATESYGFNRNWIDVSLMPPEKHVAYAVQWFGLALTLTVLSAWLSYKK
jgi:surfeit locus 1 family protein